MTNLLRGVEGEGVLKAPIFFWVLKFDTMVGQMEEEDVNPTD